MDNTQLTHYGVKGMKWGVRRKRRDYFGQPGGVKGGPYRQEGTPAGAKGGPRKQTPVGTVKSATKKRSRLDRAADAAQRDADNLRKHGYKAEADAVQKVADKNRQKAEANRQKAERRKQTVKRGAEVTAKALSKVGQAYVTDQIFWGGMGTKIVKETVKAMGMATITAYTMARGGYDIKWYDKQGRRVG